MENQISKRPIRERKICRRYDSWPIGKIIQKPGPEPKLNLAAELKRKGNNIKCITFDFGGVYTTGDIITDVFDAYRIKYGTDIMDFWRQVHDTEHWRNFFTGKLSEKDFWANVKREFNMPEFDEKLFGRHIRGASLDINPKMEALVAKLRSMRYKMALLTNNAREWFDCFPDSDRLDGFELILTSYDLGVKKPDPKIYQALLDLTKVQANECVFLDDYERNVEGARKLGIHSILFKSYEQALGELEEILGKKLN